MVDLGERISGAEGASVAPDPNWPGFRDGLRARWSQLPEDELEVQARRKRDLVSYIHDQTGAPRAEAERVLDDLSRETGFRWH